MKGSQVKYEIVATNVVKDPHKGKADKGRFFAVGESVDASVFADAGVNAEALVASGAIKPATAKSSAPVADEGKGK